MITASEQKRISEMSKKIQSLASFKPATKPAKPIEKASKPVKSFKKQNYPRPVMFVKPKAVSPIQIEDTPEAIANKLNTLKEAIDQTVIKGQLTKEQLLEFVLKELKTGKTRLEARDILNLPQRNPLDMRWHGSGVPALEAGTNITLTPLAGGGYTISATGGGGSVTPQAPTSGVVNGTNRNFTFATAPTIIFRNGIAMQKVSSNGNVNWTGTTAVVLQVAPTTDIFAL